jgi:hypothetical protein
MDQQLPQKLKITDEEFKEDVNNNIKIISEVGLVDFVPAFNVTAVDEKGEKVMIHMVIMSDIFSHSEKYNLIAQLGKGLFEKKMIPISVVFVSEGWMSKSKDLKNLKDHPKPSQDPNRIEVLQVMALTLDGRAAMTYAPISHDTNFIGNWDIIQYSDNKKRTLDPQIIGHFYRGWFEGAREKYGEAMKCMVSEN